MPDVSGGRVTKAAAKYDGPSPGIPALGRRPRSVRANGSGEGCILLVEDNHRRADRGGDVPLTGDDPQHLRNTMRKLEASTRVQAVAITLRDGEIVAA